MCFCQTVGGKTVLVKIFLESARKLRMRFFLCDRKHLKSPLVLFFVIDEPLVVRVPLCTSQDLMAFERNDMT